MVSRPEDALASYDKAIAVQPDCAEAYRNRGAALSVLKRFDDALKSYDRAISIKPDFAEAWSGRGQHADCPSNGCTCNPSNKPAARERRQRASRRR